MLGGGLGGGGGTGAGAGAGLVALGVATEASPILRGVSVGAGSSQTRSRMVRPTLNFTTRLAGTCTFSRVRGF